MPSFPSGVETCQIIFGKGISPTGNPQPAQLDVEVVLGGVANSITWEADGTPLLRLVDTFKAEAGTVGVAEVPVVDQTGWLNGALASFTNWAYKLTERVGRVTRVKYVQPQSGQETIDFDLIPDGVVGLPGSAPVVPVTSVNGQTGAVTLPEGITETDIAASIPDAETPIGSALSTTTAEVVSRAAPRLLFFDDFTDQANGAINGRDPVEGSAWLGTGATPPAVVDGGLQSTGTGYAWGLVDGDIRGIDVEFEFRGSGTAQTLTVAQSPTFNNLDTLLHLNILPTGMSFSFRIGLDWSTTKQADLSLQWTKPLLNDRPYRVSMVVDGDSLLVVGPNGETFTLADPRVLATSGPAFFVEPVGSASGRYPRVLRVTASAAPDRMPKPLDASGGYVTDGRARVVGNRWTGWEVAAGRSQSQSILPAVRLGPLDLALVLTQDAAIGDTTLYTNAPLPNGAYLTATGDNLILIDPGGDEETATVSGSPSGSSAPYTRTVAPLTKAHPAGTIIVAKNSRYAEVYYNPSTQFLYTTVALLVGNASLWLGSEGDTRIQRLAAKVIGVPSDHVVRVGRAVTASRPSASAVGNGSLFYDTTLGLPIWSDGTNWKDAAGNVV